jgi:hypothetical protein
MIGNQRTDIDKDYGDIIDDLMEKLYDLENNPREWPDFELVEFEFLLDWEQGLQPSEYVHRIISKWNIEEVAKTKLTRSLTNYMFKFETTAELIKPAIEEVRLKVLPRYVQYLKALQLFFRKAAECDRMQLPMTWLQVTSKDGDVTKDLQNLTLNQVIRQIDTFLVDNIDSCYAIEDNAACFETVSEEGGRRWHWILGPKSYLSMIKALFDVREVINLKSDIDYLKKTLAEYAS